MVFYVVKKSKKFDYSKIPSSNSKIKLQWSTHTKPVPPTPLPCPQVLMIIYNRFWLVCTGMRRIQFAIKLAWGNNRVRENFMLKENHLIRKSLALLLPSSLFWVTYVRHLWITIDDFILLHEKSNFTIPKSLPNRCRKYL